MPHRCGTWKLVPKKREEQNFNRFRFANITIHNGENSLTADCSDYSGSTEESAARCANMNCTRTRNSQDKLLQFYCLFVRSNFSFLFPLTFDFRFGNGEMFPPNSVSLVCIWDCIVNGQQPITTRINEFLINGEAVGVYCLAHSTSARHETLSPSDRLHIYDNVWCCFW